MGMHTLAMAARSSSMQLSLRNNTMQLRSSTRQRSCTRKLPPALGSYHQH